MCKFKVGDKVVRLHGGGSDELFKHLLGDKKHYTVTSTSYSGAWLQLDGVVRNGDACPWRWSNFELYQEPDDELPPVPSSVTYMNTKRDPGNDQRLVLERDREYDEGLLSITIIPRKSNTWEAQEIGINMSPDAALQLAHDIRRMAMDIKRKEKLNV